MEKINLQTNQLKLNVTNIKSFLIDSNKKLNKIRNTEKTLAQSIKQKQKFKSEEKRIESPLKKVGPITNIAKKIVGKPLSFFDRLKEFLGLLFVGFIVNSLPKIISSIKNFFDENPLIGKSVKFIIDIIGKGFNGIISLVDFFTAEKRDRISKDAKDLESGFNKLNSELDIDISSIGSTPTNFEDENVTRNANDPNQMSDGSVINIGDTVGGPAFAPPSEPRKQKFSKGGKVSPTTPSKGRSSVGAKKAVQTTNYFSDFRKNYVTFGMMNQENEKNRETFEKIVEQLKQTNGFSALKSGKEKPMHKGSASRGSSNSSPSAGSQVYDGLPDSAIVGRVGFTGFVKPPGPDGAHVHIETGSGRGDNRGPVPSHIFDKVMVGGRPLSQWNMNSGYGIRWGNYFHDGHDFAMAAGNPIQLHKDLKLVEYAPGNNAGFGNLIMFTDKQGNTYIITHLQSGPERAPQPPANNDKSGQGPGGPGYGRGGAIAPMKSDYKVTEEIDDDEESSVFFQPIIINQNTPVLLPFG